MREILFRGKDVRTGYWKEGSLVREWLGVDIGYTIRDVPDRFNQIAFRNIVDPKTIGQYTGLTDKNGRKIFEGDIVAVPLSGKPAKGIVEYFKTDICGFTVITQPQYSNYVLQKNYAYEVIGNIHDNPELLEE